MSQSRRFHSLMDQGARTAMSRWRPKLHPAGASRADANC
jgi:hypothetical protein